MRNWVARFVGAILASSILFLPCSVFATVVSEGGSFTVRYPESVWNGYIKNGSTGEISEYFTSPTGGRPSKTGEYFVSGSSDSNTLNISGKPPGVYSYSIVITGEYSAGNAGGISEPIHIGTVEVLLPEAQSPGNDIPFTEYVNLAKFDIYYGDFNNDGNDGDIYFHGRDVFVLIAGEVSVPLLLDGPEGFVYYRVANGYSEALALDIDKAELGDFTKAKKGVDYLNGDLSGDGKSDYFIRGNQAGVPALTIFQASQGYPSASVPNIPSFDLSDRSLTLQLRDYNGDGRDDLVYLSEEGGYVLDVIYSNESGELQEGYYDASNIDEIFNISTFAKNVTGTLEGQFRVSESGAATYNIPLFIPQGTAGVKPSVSLAYSSQSGSGIMGDGWSLGAYSAITRCRQVKAVDGTSKAITWTNEDRYCLDGQRLLLVDDAYAYGVSGSTYRTEIDSGVVVKIHGDANGEPDYFSAISKDGGLSYYGYAGSDNEHQSEQSFAVGKTYMWAQTRMMDNIGNPVEYYYKHSSGKDFRLDKIEYAFGDNGLLSSYPMASIEFGYELRPDKSTGFLAGYETGQQWRLKVVDVNYEVNSRKTLRSYHVFYNRNLTSSTAKKRSLVAAIQECVGSSCKVATRFDWELQSGQFPTTATHSLENVLKDQGVKGYRAADINGDGVQDLVWLTLKVDDEGIFEPPNANHYLNYAISENGQLVKKQFVGESLKDSLTFYENEREFVRFEVLDFNLDGRQDIAVMHSRSSNYEWEIYLSVPTEAQGGVGWVLSSDRSVTKAAGRHSMLIDVNGDGLVDVLDGEWAYLLQPKGSLPCAVDCDSHAYYEFSSAVSVPWSWSGFERYTDSSDIEYPALVETVLTPRVYGAGDFNGDGLIDIVAADRKSLALMAGPDLDDSLGQSVSERLVVLVRTEGGYSVSRVLGERTGLDEDSKRLGFNNKVPIASDLNGDGLTDILWREDNKIEYWLSNGTGFEQKQEMATVNNDDPIQLVDLNYDGTPEILSYAGHSSNDKQTRVYRYDEANNNGLGGYSYQGHAIRLPNNKNAPGTFADFNGDGLLDYIHKNDDDLDIYIYQSDVGKKDQVVAIRSGEGTRTDITYEPINKPNSEHYSGLDINPAKVSQESQCAWNGRQEACIEYSLYSADDFYTALNKGLNTSVETHLPSNTPIMEMMGPHYVVTDVTNTVPSSTLDNDVSSPDGNTGAGSVTSTTTASVSYIYNEAKIQAGGRGFLGFHQLSTVDNQTGVTTTTVYRQDFPFQGSPLATYRYAPSGEILSESHNVYDLHGINTTSFNGEGGTGYLGALFPYVKTSYEISYATASSKDSGGSVTVLEGSGLYQPCTASKCPNFSAAVTTKQVSQQIVTTTGLDDYGNIVDQTVSTYGEGLSQTIETHHTYGEGQRIALRESALGWNPTYAELARLTRTTVERTRNSVSEGVKATEFSYYTAAEGGAAAGMLKQSAVASGYAPANGGNNDRTLTTTYHYNDFGNIERTIVSGWDGVGVVERTSRTEYDDTGRFITATYIAGERLGDNTATIAEIKTSEVTARNEYGAPTASEEVNGLSTTYHYDAWGRETYKGANTGVWASTQYVACPYNSGGVSCPQGATTAVIKRSAASKNTIQSVAFFDLMGRQIQTATRGFDGQFILVDTEYSVTGNVVRTSEPYFASDGVSLWTRIYYDELGGRPIYTLTPDGSDGEMRYNGDTVITINAFGQRKEEIKNGFGELVRAKDTTGSYVDYHYTTEGQLRSTRVVAADSSHEGAYHYGTIEGLCEQPTSNLQSIICYDELGRKTQMWDPDKGHWQYAYNAFGQLIAQTDANGQSIIINYDALGRKASRRDYLANGAQEGLTSWYYDSEDDSGQPVANAWQQMTAVVYSKGNGSAEQDGSNYAQRMVYDEYGRLELTRTFYPNGTDYDTRVEYQDDGRIAKEFNVLTDAVIRNNATFDSGIEKHYNDWGFLEKITNLEDGEEVYKPQAYDARGQLKQALLGNGASLGFDYYEDTGLLREKTASAAFTSQSITYQWDNVGNLRKRATSSGDLGSEFKNTECFDYDNLNRLTKSYRYDGTTLAGCPPSGVGEDIVYDSLGNIQSKVGYGTYGYGQVDSTGHRAGPHALTSLSSNGSAIFKYDNNGSLLSDGERTFEYSTYSKPTKIRNATHTVEFEYGPSRARYYRKDTSANGVEQTWYLGNVEKVVKANGTIEWRRSLEGGGLYTYTTNSSHTETTPVVKRYMLQDHLGSSNILMNNDGTIAQLFGFDEWGLRRDAKDMSAFTASERINFDNSITTKGFTGHEMVDALHIVHMNGRIYDARWGRFLQADPFVEAPTDVQSYNRYAYVRNNPLNATDPSGYFIEPLIIGTVIGYMFQKMSEMTGIQAFGIIGSIVACVSSGGANAIPCAGGAGFGSTYAATGHLGKSIQSGVISAVSAKAFSMIGEKASAAGKKNTVWVPGTQEPLVMPGAVKFAGNFLMPHQIAMQIGAHALVGGIAADLQGGKFGHGFISAGATKGIMGAFNFNYKDDSTSAVAGRTLIAGAVGGTITDALGGKFANGAITAAMGHLFNQEGIGEEEDTPLLSRSERMEFIKSIGADVVDIGNSIDLAADLLSSPEGIAILKNMFPEMASMPAPYIEAYIKVMGDSYVDSKSLLGLMGGDASVEKIKEYAVLNLKVYRAFKADNWLKRAGGLAGAAKGLSDGASTKNMTILQFYGDQWLARDPF